LSRVDLQDVIEILREFVRETRKPLELILVGGLALQYYGMEGRATIDLDAEIRGDLEGLFNFLKQRGIPSDLGEDMTGWSVVSMPPGYRDRAKEIVRDENLVIKVLEPVDFVIAKLRRGTEEDMSDATYVARRFVLDRADIARRAEDAVNNSPKDTLIFVFRKNAELFLRGLEDER
jgi:hypothetical protein